VKLTLSPFRIGGVARLMSPCGGSTLTTSAPMSASSVPHSGPAMKFASSMTRMPASGLAMTRYTDALRAAEYGSRAGRRHGSLPSVPGMLELPQGRTRGHRREGAPRMAQGYDTIIVGGGAAGCVLANRLSTRSNHSVLLLEAGRDTPPGGEPADVADTYPGSYYNPAYFWPEMKVHWRLASNSPLTGYSQARIMGGGSSVMGMVALRGTPDDYAEWETLGASGWGWNDVLPFFRKLENDFDFGGDLHGKQGPVPVRRIPRDQWPPISKALAEFANERQYPFVADMNADFRDGYASVPISAWPDKRGSAAICYLTPDVRARNNLTIITGAMVTGVNFDGRRATVVTVDVGGETREFAAKEVIISLGGIHSAALLMRCGIGPAAHLREHSIAVRADMPGVGANLSNHSLLFIGFHLPRAARQSRSLRPHPMSVLRFSSGVADCPRTDMYINVQSKTSWSALGQRIANLAPALWKPKGRGRVALRSADPRQEPLVEMNFAGHEHDLKRLMVGFRLAVEMLAYERMKALHGAQFPVKFTDRLRLLNRKTPANAVKSQAIAWLTDLVPALAGPVFGTLADRKVDLLALVKDDDALAEHVRQNVAGMFHVAGTCRMGAATDRDAVVDRFGRVRGFDGLRVVDASVMPTVPRGNTNIPTIMVAEKMAAAIVAAS
jgi:5-(hydroxymethyl)furfural/furfural oxidase